MPVSSPNCQSCPKMRHRPRRSPRSALARRRQPTLQPGARDAMAKVSDGTIGVSGCGSTRPPHATTGTTAKRSALVNPLLGIVRPTSRHVPSRSLCQPRSSPVRNDKQLIQSCLSPPSAPSCQFGFTRGISGTIVESSSGDMKNRPPGATKSRPLRVAEHEGLERGPVPGRGVAAGGHQRFSGKVGL